MKKFVDNFRPRIEFEKEEALELDKIFFRKAFEAACSMQGPQTAYAHRVFEDCKITEIEIQVQYNALHSGQSRSALYDYLVNLAAIIARNARLAKHLMDAEKGKHVQS